MYLFELSGAYVANTISNKQHQRGPNAPMITSAFVYEWELRRIQIETSAVTKNNNAGPKLDFRANVFSSLVLCNLKLAGNYNTLEGALVEPQDPFYSFCR